MRFPNPREVRSLLYQKDISAKRSSKDQELLEVCVRILSKLDGPISNTSLGYKLRENPEWKKLVPSSGLTKFLRNEDRKKYFSVTDELKDGGWVTWVQYTGCPLPKGSEQTFQELALVDSEAPLTVSENKLVEEMQELVKRLECSSEEKEKWEALRVLVERLTRKKRPKYKIDAYLFGSTANSLGATGCDIDICLRILDKEKPIDHKKIGPTITSIQGEIHKEGFENIQAVLHAKVPHLKFYAPNLGWGDVSINGIDCLQKTKLLKSYCELDDRIRPVILVMKEWIQRRKINQASQDGGTLNSFCYTLMFIAFMQIKHGLPSLQRLCCVPHISTTLTGVKPTTTCLSCRNPLPQEPSWFFEDIHELKKVYQSDKDTIAELFLGFLRFYAFELNYIQQVVSVRVGALITREEKGWPVDLSCTNTQLIKLLCVEDPFDLSRNVATSAKTWVVEGIRWEFERAVREFKTNGLAGLLEKYISPRDITEFMHQYPWSLNNDEKPLRGSSGCL